jgi:hypothetical protein
MRLYSNLWYVVLLCWTDLLRRFMLFRHMYRRNDMLPDRKRLRHNLLPIRPVVQFLYLWRHQMLPHWPELLWQFMLLRFMQLL